MVPPQPARLAASGISRPLAIANDQAPALPPVPDHRCHNSDSNVRPAT